MYIYSSNFFLLIISTDVGHLFRYPILKFFQVELFGYKFQKLNSIPSQYVPLIGKLGSSHLGRRARNYSPPTHTQEGTGVQLASRQEMLRYPYSFHNQLEVICASTFCIHAKDSASVKKRLCWVKMLGPAM